MMSGMRRGTATLQGSTSIAMVLIVTFAVVARGADGDVKQQQPPVEIIKDVPTGLPSVRSVMAITAGPMQHFVGYYGITPWNGSGTRLACLEANFGDRLVEANDRAGICLVDPTTHQLTRIAETLAWNLQQGAMLHWLPTAPDRELVFNNRVDGRLISTILDVESGRTRTIDRPIAAISPDGKLAISLNYERLRRIRPVTGYAGGEFNAPLIKRPTDDGLFIIDLASGKSRLFVSIDDACRSPAVPKSVVHEPFWLEHAMFSRDGLRLFMIARAFDPTSRQLVSLPLTVATNGAALHALLPWGVQGASHYDWLDERQLVLTREYEPNKWHHLLIDADDTTAKPQILAPDVLTQDGHCTFSPDGHWMITDTYPDEHRRQHLFILDVKSNRAARIASFYAPEQYHGDWRCDLHPRWSRDGKQICIDSTHDGIRQVYVVDLAMPAV